MALYTYLMEDLLGIENSINEFLISNKTDPLSRADRILLRDIFEGELRKKGISPEFYNARGSHLEQESRYCTLLGFLELFYPKLFERYISDKVKVILESDDWTNNYNRALKKPSE